MRITIEDLEALKELNDELEENHLETEKSLQDEISAIILCAPFYLSVLKLDIQSKRKRRFVSTRRRSPTLRRHAKTWRARLANSVIWSCNCRRELCSADRYEYRLLISLEPASSKYFARRPKMQKLPRHLRHHKPPRCSPPTSSCSHPHPRPRRAQLSTHSPESQRARRKTCCRSYNPICRLHMQSRTRTRRAHMCCSFGWARRRT
jgi:hypothetical protein